MPAEQRTKQLDLPHRGPAGLWTGGIGRNRTGGSSLLGQRREPLDRRRAAHVDVCQFRLCCRNCAVQAFACHDQILHPRAAREPRRRQAASSS
jgi:hypothetical protein